MKVSFLYFCAVIFLFHGGCGAQIEERQQDKVQVTARSSQIEQPKLDSFQPKPNPEIENNITRRRKCPLVSARAEQLIALHSDKLRGAEPCFTRDIAKVDELEVVLFTLEGLCRDKQSPKGSCGNNYSRYMVGILEGKELTPIQVGVKTDFSAESVDVVDGIIVVSGKFHQEGDGLCCPSKEGQRNFNIIKNRFREITVPRP